MITTKKPRRMARAPQVDAGDASELNTPVIVEKRATKQSLVLDLLLREGGASLAEIVAATEWLPHTARAALTGLRKKGHLKRPGFSGGGFV